MRKRALKLVGTVLVLAMVATACTGGDSAVTTSTVDNPDRVASSGQPDWPTGKRAALVQFDACDEFLDYVITNAVDLVGPYGLESPGFWPRAFGRDVLESAAADSALAGGDGGGLRYSDTNVQVLGVDEPDMVKTDGKRIVSLNEGRLIVTDVTGDEPKVVSRLNLPDASVQNLFLHGDTVLLFGSGWSGGPIPLAEPAVDGFVPYYETPTIQLIEVDISGDDIEIVRTMAVDGQYVSARMVGDSVRMVLTSSPVGFEWSYPKGDGLRAERKAVEENRDIIRNSSADNWIPYYLVTDADGDVVAEGTLFDCDRASHPEEFSGVNMLSVMTIDVGNGLDVVDSTGVLANGNTVYASADNLYVATQDWNTWRWATGAEDDSEPESVVTDIHKFDISSEDFTSYLATGRVEGYLLNQFAMDEHRGYLRVASTTRPTWWGSNFESESLVTVLEEGDGTLDVVGHVDGLGLTEQIYSVRFMGDVGYVVTFRQTDPLYTVDLSDPANPEVVGELKIPGYSAYLHPVGEGLLLGVGQDADEDGRVLGAQASLFDVSDPANPQKIDQYTLSKGSSSSIEYDHHAFLFWEDTGLVMMPIQQWWWSEDDESVFMGAVGLRVGDDLDEIRRISHPGGDRDDWDWRAQITRSIVIGDYVYTISAKGILKSELDSLEESAWMGF